MGRIVRALALMTVLAVAVGCANSASEKFDETGGAVDGAAATDDTSVRVGPGDELVRDSATGGADGPTSGDERSAGDDERSAGGDERSAGGDERPAGDDEEDPADPVEPGELAPGRHFVSTGGLVIVSDDVATTTQRAIALVEGKGGGLFSESSTYQGEVQATLTLKVPPEEFSSTLRALGELGEVAEQTVDTEDVTERVVDLESRIETASNSVERLRGFLGGATTVADVANFEAQLNDRETELESLRAQLRTLDERIELATIVLTVREEADGLVAEEDDEKPLPSFLDAVGGSWEALLTVGTVALAILGAIVPWIPLLLAVWLLARLWQRRAARASLPPPPAPASMSAGS